jgi:outer membrane protein
MKRFFLTLSLAAVAATALGQDSPLSLSPGATATAGGATLTDCYQAALKHSASLDISFESIAQAQERYRQAMGSVLPSLTFSGAFFTQSAPPDNQNQFRFTATQPLFQGLREYAALRLTKDQLASSKQAYRAAAWQLYADTAAAFNAVLAQEKDLADLQSELTLYGDRIKFLQGWLNIGRAQDTDVLSIQSAQAQINAQIEAVKYSVAAAREVLAFLTGAPADQALVDDQAAPSQLDTLGSYAAALEQRPDLIAAKANIEAAKEGVNIAWGQHLPQVSASADYYPYRYLPNTDANWDAYLSVSLPLFMGGVINSQTRAAESAQRAAEAALEQARRQDAEALRTAYAKLSFDLAQAKALQDAADLAQKDYKAETRNFERGLVTNLNVLQAMVTYVNTVQAVDATHYATQSDLQGLQALTGRAPGLPEPASLDEK